MLKKINPSLVLYFISYILYLFFFIILEDKETILLFKPIILASITFYYVSYSKVKKNVLHFVVVGAFFVSDNMNLFGEFLFHEIAIAFYIIAFFILLYLIVRDSKLLVKGSSLEIYFGIIIIILILLFVFATLTSIYVLKTKIHHYYFIFNYVVVFLSVLFLSFYNLFKRKTLSSKFLVLWLFSLFMADLLTVINSYYFSFKMLVYLSSLFELPSYYFMVRYFIARDKEAVK
jgi:hypothetical protein